MTRSERAIETLRSDPERRSHSERAAGIIGLPRMSRPRAEAMVAVNSLLFLHTIIETRQ